MKTRIGSRDAVKVLPTAQELQEWEAGLRSARLVAYAAIIMLFAGVGVTAGFMWAIFGGLK